MADADEGTQQAHTADDVLQPEASQPDVAAPAFAEQRPQQQRRRTIDVTTGAASFDELMLPDWMLRGLAAGGFLRPSPVQTAAIPLGRLGADLIVQAKAGTGKTLVFGIICLDKLQAEVAAPQALVLAPTHEIALQSAEVLGQLAAHMPAPGTAVGIFIGGLPISEDQKLLRRRCNIAVGTPGRICRLLEIGALVPKYIRTLVLDEADHLMSDSFLRDIRYLAKTMLPKRKQVLALSATYPPALLAELDDLTDEPHHVMLCPETVSLLGVKQFFHQLPEGLDGDALLEAKVQQLLRVLSTTTFHQALVFCNGRPEGQALANRLCALGYPSVFVSGSHAQVDRMDAIAAVHDFRVRVVVATDLAARGLDLANVNLVANLDLPYDAATYMHRVGRTGRFGTHGVAIAFVTSSELQRLHGFLQDVAGGQIEQLPDQIPENLYVSQSMVEQPDAAAPAAPQEQHRQGAIDPGRDDLVPSQQVRAGEDADRTQPSAVSSHQWDNQGSDAASVPAAAPQQVMLWTRSEGSLSDDPEAAYDDGEWVASAASDADAYSEVTVSLGGDATDADVAPDGVCGPWQHANGRPLSSAAAAVLGMSLWAEPAASGHAKPLPFQANGLRRHPSEASAEHDAPAPDQHAAEPSGHPETDAAPQPAPPPPPPELVSGAEGIMVPPELLVRYYQLEAWAAEYYAWFCRTQQHRQ